MKLEQNDIDELLALRGTLDIEDNWQAMRALETLPLDSKGTQVQTPPAQSPAR